MTLEYTNGEEWNMYTKQDNENASFQNFNKD